MQITKRKRKYNSNANEDELSASENDCFTIHA